MTDSGYAELHCHSCFSLLDGASSPEELVARARDLGMPALALTDHEDLGGAPRFAQVAADEGVGGIIGAELTVDTGGAALPPAPSHLVLLAESREGYGNLCSLVTRARMDHPRGTPRVSLDTLARHARGLFALTGCPRGWVPALVARGDPDGACEALATLLDLFERRVAVECWDHHLPEERAIVRQLIPLARSLGVPWVVTNDVHYAAPGGRLGHDVLGALRHQRALDEMGTRLRPNGEWYLKGAAQMRRRWQGEDAAGLRATLEVAARCAFRLGELRPSLPAFPLPPGVSADEYLERLVEQGAGERYGPERGTRNEETNDARQTAAAPHDAAFRIPDSASSQIAHELSVIRRLGLAGYFLIVWDIVRFARRTGVLCQGRGSAANSAVCYCLGITAVDPIRLGLLFERFLSEDRREAPDIDIDFAHRDRELVLQYVYDRYGREHAAMVCEHITWRGRSAVRDAARVLGFSVEQANALSVLSDRFSAKKTAEAMTGDAESGMRNAEADALGRSMVPGTEATTIARATKQDAREGARTRRGDSGYRAWNAEHGMRNTSAPASASPTRIPDSASRIPDSASRIPDSASQSHDSLLTHAGLDPRDHRVRALARIVRSLHQIPRHRSIHVGGFVLTAEPLSTVVPIEPASMPDRTVIQWEKDDLEPVGLVKIDLLGLGMLTLLQDCLVYIRATRGVTVDLARLDMTDQAVYDDLCAADTIGVFQVESRAQMNTLPRLKPRCFYDLVVEVALIRPGPIQGDMVHPYLRRRAGVEPVTYPHPSLEPILRRTLGIPLFQEQGMRVAITAAGFTPGEADTLRRAMGHKRSHERMAAICERLVAGMARNGIPEETAHRIYNQINAFADYGFPESHAASFALLVYASAYLRHYYAPEFTAAILNAQPMGFYSVGTLIEDARRHGVEVRPVDLTRSTWETGLETRKNEERGTRSQATSARPASAPPGVTPAPAVRLGLRLVRGLGPRARERLEAALGQGPFTSIADVIARSGLDRRSLRLLAEAGAFDAMVPEEPDERRRRAALWRMLEEFRGDAGPLAPRTVSPRSAALPAAVPAMRRYEITEADYRLTGLSLNGHPMQHVRPLLAPNGILTARAVQQCRDGARVAVAGLVICRQRPGTARGFVFLTLEDETGMVNVVVTPKRFERQALLIARAPLLLVRGTLQVEERVVNIRGERFRELAAQAGEAHAQRHDFH